MKHLWLLSIVILTSTHAFSQENKRYENIIRLSGGLFLEDGLRAVDNPGAALKISYGLDFSLSNGFSLMPGVGARIQLGDIRHIPWKGGNPDGAIYTDLFCITKYHWAIDGTRISVGLGPQLSYDMSPSRYNIDYDPFSPLSDKQKFHSLDWGIIPCMEIRSGKHWIWGAEASIGLRNLLIQYPEYNVTGSVHFYNLLLTCGYAF